MSQEKKTHTYIIISSTFLLVLKFITTELTKAASLSLSCRAPSSVRGGTGLIRGIKKERDTETKEKN